MSYTLYYEDSAERYFNHDLNQYKKKTDLNIATYDNATIAVNTSTGAYGIFDADKNFIQSSTQMRHTKGQFIPRKRDVHNADRRDETVMFLGNIYPHFGHFMLEHLNRAYGISRVPCDKYVFINNRNINVQNWVYEFMDMLGIAREKVLILTRTTQFKRVIIPDQSFNIDTWYAPEFAEPFATMRAAMPRTGGGGTKRYICQETT